MSKVSQSVSRLDEAVVYPSIYPSSFFRVRVREGVKQEYLSMYVQTKRSRRQKSREEKKLPLMNQPIWEFGGFCYIMPDLSRVGLGAVGVASLVDSA